MQVLVIGRARLLPDLNQVNTAWQAVFDTLFQPFIQSNVPTFPAISCYSFTGTHTLLYTL